MTIEKISSRENKRLKEAKRVRDGQADDLMFVEGVRLAEEAISSSVKVREGFVTSRFVESERGSAILKAMSGAPLFELTESVLDSINDTKSSQGVILICERPARPDFDSFPRPGKLPVVVFMAEANNPSNLGAVVRVTEAAGASGLITSRNSADVYSPRALRASMGSAFRLPIIQGENHVELFEWSRRKGMKITAAAGEGISTYSEIDWKLPRLLVFGSEAHGLNDEQLRLVDETMRVPMENPVESLNLSVAAGIILFEARKQFYL